MLKAVAGLALILLYLPIVVTGAVIHVPTDQPTIQAGIDATLASGSDFGNWRAGFTNVAAGSSYVSSWSQNIPALASVIGNNVFSLSAADVTPLPYNQPPYPPAGDTDTDSCTVTGIEP